MNNEKLETIMNEHKDLTTHGHGLDYYSEDKFIKERAALHDKGIEFETCCDYLKLLKRRKSSTKQLGSSYRLKHLVEKWFRDTTGKSIYIPEGAFIAAAYYLGFTCERIPGRTSVYLNISLHTKINGEWIH